MGPRDGSVDRRRLYWQTDTESVLTGAGIVTFVAVSARSYFFTNAGVRLPKIILLSDDIERPDTRELVWALLCHVYPMQIFQRVIAR